MSSLKICIPIPDRPEGGMYTFARTFAAYLEAHGIAVTREIAAEYDVLFVNSWAVPFGDVRRIKEQRPAVRVVQRVDGSSRDYGGYMRGDRIQARVNVLADLTIFQSRYSQFSTREKYRIIAHNGPIIFNPVDLRVFTPRGPRLQFAPGRVRVACASWSLNRGKGTHEIDELAAASPEIDFVLCGRFEGITVRPNVARLGHLGPAALAEALRSCDLFLNLSRNDPAPNVVTEALACGLPVLYRDSGGVPELVGNCGTPIGKEGVPEGVERLMRRRDELSAAARHRAETVFAPEVIFPTYLREIAACTRRRVPDRVERLRLWLRGYPVISLRQPTTTPRHDAPARVPLARTRPYRIGWITYDSFRPGVADFRDLDSFTRMRAGNVASWMNQHTDEVSNELYRRGRRYDLVVFQKVMGRSWERDVRRLQERGTIVVFDANVNYYDIWGDYDVPDTKPTLEQQRAAIWMARHADWVVADSSYLATVIRKWTPNVTWIPDNVNLDVYSGMKEHVAKRPLTLIWSGVAKKAAHLRLIGPVLASLEQIELVIVSDETPDLAWLPASVRTRIVPFDDATYARALLDADVIVSPKHLSNGYEMAHTEYKITLGMAVGLPAVASGQPSYTEAIGDRCGGIVARTSYEWATALADLSRNVALRQEMGSRARQIVVERYSTDAVGRQYFALLGTLLREQAPGVAGAGR